MRGTVFIVPWWLRRRHRWGARAVWWADTPAGRTRFGVTGPRVFVDGVMARCEAGKR